MVGIVLCLSPFTPYGSHPGGECRRGSANDGGLQGQIVQVEARIGHYSASHDGDDVIHSIHGEVPLALRFFPIGTLALTVLGTFSQHVIKRI